MLAPQAPCLGDTSTSNLTYALNESYLQMGMLWTRIVLTAVFLGRFLHRLHRLHRLRYVTSDILEMIE